MNGRPGPGRWTTSRPRNSSFSRRQEQLHTSIPNSSGRARYSVDFRTVDAGDLLAGRGAPLVDAHCTGTAIRDFRNVADESSFDEETVTQLFGAPPPGAMLVFGRAEAARSAQSV